MKKYGLLLPALLLLAGCSGTADTGAPKADSPSATRTPSATPTPEITPDVAAYCDRFYGSMQDYVDFVLAAAEGNVDYADYEPLMASQVDLEALAPLQMRGTTADYGLPLYEISEVIDDGGGNVSLSSGDFRDASVEILEYCVDEGQTVG